MIYLNNRLVPGARARVSVFDHGFLYGDGVYETLRAYEGTVFMLDEHMERLFHSASLISLMIPKTPEEIKAAVYETLGANRLKEAVIRITVSRGEGPLGLDPDLCQEPTFVIFSGVFKGYPAGQYQNGVNIAFVNTRRNYISALDPQIKSLNFLNNILAKIEAKKINAYEAVMLNYRGYVAEGTISNIFFVNDNILCTPAMDVGILGGITRRIILDIAGESGIRTKEGKFRPEKIYDADEVFISNSTMEVMPVTQVDGREIGSAAGEITRALHCAYRKRVAEYIKGDK